MKLIDRIGISDLNNSRHSFTAFSHYFLPLNSHCTFSHYFLLSFSFYTFSLFFLSLSLSNFSPLSLYFVIVLSLITSIISRHSRYLLLLSFSLFPLSTFSHYFLTTCTFSNFFFCHFLSFIFLSNSFSTFILYLLSLISVFTFSQYFYSTKNILFFTLEIKINFSSKMFSSYRNL